MSRYKKTKVLAAVLGSGVFYDCCELELVPVKMTGGSNLQYYAAASGKFLCFFFSLKNPHS